MSAPGASDTMCGQFDALIKAWRRRPLWQDGPHTRTVDCDRAVIMRLLQHRDPFLLLDGISAIDLEQAALRGLRHIDMDDPVFAGHFPGEPVYPGALLVETMGQLAGCLAYFYRNRTYDVGPDAQPQRIRAFKIYHAVFLAEVLPGDELTVLTQMIDSNDFTMICAGQILRNDTVCCFAIMEAYFVGD